MTKEQLTQLAKNLGFTDREVVAFKVGAGFMKNLLSRDGKMLYCENPSNNSLAEYWCDQKTNKSVLQGKLIHVEEIKNV
jgi:hypothetical protein